MKWKKLIMFGALAVLLVLSACSNNGNDTATNQNEEKNLEGDHSGIDRKSVV